MTETAPQTETQPLTRFTKTATGSLPLMTFSKKLLVVILLSSALLFRLLLSCSQYPSGEEGVAYTAAKELVLARNIGHNWFGAIYPPLLAISSAPLYAPCMLSMKLLHVIPKISDWEAYENVALKRCLLPGRLVSCLAGTMSVIILFYSARRFFGFVPAFVSAGVFSLSLVHLLKSGKMEPDVLAAFFCTLCLYYGLKTHFSGERKHLVWAGAFAGLAFATKIFPVMIAWSLVVFHADLLIKEGRVLSIKAWLDKYFIFSLLSVVAVYVIGNPAWLFSMSTWTYYIVRPFSAGIYLSDGLMGTTGAPYIGLLRAFFREDMVTALFLLGMLLTSLVVHNRSSICLLIITLVPFMFVGLTKSIASYYLLFLFPSLFYFVSAVLQQLESCFGKQTTNAMNALLASLLLLTFGYSAYWVAERLKPDNREIAQQWIHQNIPENQSILLDWEYNPELVSADTMRDRLAGGHQQFYKAYYERNQRMHRAYPIEILPYGVTNLTARLRNATNSIFVASGGCYARFIGGDPPPPEHRLFHVFLSQRDAYSLLLARPDRLNWKCVSKFVDGSGPVIMVYQRIPQN